MISNTNIEEKTMLERLKTSEFKRVSLPMEKNFKLIQIVVNC